MRTVEKQNWKSFAFGNGQQMDENLHLDDHRKYFNFWQKLALQHIDVYVDFMSLKFQGETPVLQGSKARSIFEILIQGNRERFLGEGV